jgi:hypothetical protein
MTAITEELYEHFIGSLHENVLASLASILDTGVHLSERSSRESKLEPIRQGTSEVEGDFNLVLKSVSKEDNEEYSGSPNVFPLEGLSVSESARAFVNKGFSLVMNKLHRRHRSVNLYVPPQPT